MFTILKSISCIFKLSSSASRDVEVILIANYVHSRRRAKQFGVRHEESARMFKTK